MQNLPLLAKHLQPIPHQLNHDFLFDKALNINIASNGEIACALSKKPYTNAQTPGHLKPAGYTSTNKWKPARMMPSKIDKRVGK